VTDPDFYDEGALLERLTRGVRKEVVFLVGSAVTAPTAENELGVPGVDGVIDLIRQEFDSEQVAALNGMLAEATNPYQVAFSFLLGRRGPQASNRVIKAAMARARRPTYSSGTLNTYKLSADTDEDSCRAFDNDRSGWFLSPAVKGLGELCARYPAQFGRTILTTNFDPLLEVAISNAGGTHYRTVLHRDGNFQQTEGEGTHVIHMHGYWFGSDTLHTPRQLGQPRPLLRASLAHLIRNKIVVVMGYGGWDDAFAEALAEVITDDNAYPEVIWAFYQKNPPLPTALAARLQPGLARGRVTLYDGIDCHSIVPKASAWWARNEPSTISASSTSVQEIPIPQAIPAEKRPLPKLQFDKEERPPNIDFYVGRNGDLNALTEKRFKVGFITGMGGQGKSALAGAYFKSATTEESFQYRVWRDCKEQSDTFEDKVVRLVASLSRRRVSANDLATQPMESIADLFAKFTADTSVLIVFDNVDHYVDLESGRLLGSLGRFVSHFVALHTKSQILFTCRPPVFFPNDAAISHRIVGLEKVDARRLFQLRKAVAANEEIDRAHDLTNGHALWLDLLAAQVAKSASNLLLSDLLQSIAAGNAELPEPTLRSIWVNLPSREKIVLQSLAETLRPTTELQLADYLDTRLRYNQFSKALRSLRDMNLIVVRPLDRGEEGLELHPLIRAFIRSTFPITERITFIDAILRVYGAFFVSYSSKQNAKPTLSNFDQWIEGAELSVNAGKYGSALSLLSEVEKIVARRAPPGEFTRVCKQLFDSPEFAKLVSLKHFETVFNTYVTVLSKMERVGDAIEALEKYSDTLEGKGARFIHYCDMQCYMHWTNRNFPAAVKWGMEGKKLKSESGVDTAYSTDHNLALAQRDSGDIDQALIFFMNGSPLDEIIKPDSLDLDRGATFYGNIGRCFQLMGQVETALACYRKSAYLLQKDSSDDPDLENQAYVRQWIGELLEAKGERIPAFLFLNAAALKWAAVSPPRAKRINEYLSRQSFEFEYSDEAIENFCSKWIREPYAEKKKLSSGLAG
jgi:tetratricopeptide (TPR) repeat protein